MSVVTELENALQAMLATKPPGVSGSKINQITDLSAKNVQVLLPTERFLDKRCRQPRRAKQFIKMLTHNNV